MLSLHTIVIGYFLDLVSRFGQIYLTSRAARGRRAPPASREIPHPGSPPEDHRRRAGRFAGNRLRKFYVILVVGKRPVGGFPGRD